MKIIQYVFDGEGRHLLYLEGENSPQMIIQGGQFEKKTLITYTFCKGNQKEEVDFLLEDQEQVVYLMVKGSSLFTDTEEWLRQERDQRYYIFGKYNPTSLLDTLENWITTLPLHEELHENMAVELFQLIDRYMKNPMSHRMSI